MLDTVIQYVNDSFAPKGVEHFEKTVYWIQKLQPDADESMLIAAYAHDIARAFENGTVEEKYRDREMNDPIVLEEHQTEGARLISEFLQNLDVDPESIARVSNMVSKHEVGGDEESDLLMNADSISYLEVNAPKHVERFISLIGKGKVERKINWMFDRISSAKAKELAEPFYQAALKALSEVT